MGNERESRRLWHNIIFMAVVPLVAAISVPVYLYQNGSSWKLWLFFAVCYTLSNMSITCGYHRYFAHRSYDVHSWIEAMYVIIGSGAFQGSVLQWASDHRRHHRRIDTDGDPYNIYRGFWYAHLSWMFREDTHPEAKILARDLQSNRLIAFQHRHYAPLAAAIGFLVPGLIAWALGLGFWGGVFFGGFLRIVTTQHSTFLINSFAHTFGRQTYTDKHTARDSLFLSLLTFGEGYHNYHHSFQADYRNGIRWYHWDPTKWWITFLSWIGLAKRLRAAPREEILRVRLAMEAKLLLAKGVSQERVLLHKSRIEDAQKRVKQLRDAYRLAKRNLATRGKTLRGQIRDQRLQMRTEIRMAEIEFRSAYGQWRTFYRALKRTVRNVQAA